MKAGLIALVALGVVVIISFGLLYSLKKWHERIQAPAKPEIDMRNINLNTEGDILPNDSESDKDINGRCML